MGEEAGSEVIENELNGSIDESDEGVESSISEYAWITYGIEKDEEDGEVLLIQKRRRTL